MTRNELTYNDLPGAVQELGVNVQEIKRLLENQPSVPKTRLLTISEASDLLTISKPTLYRWVSERKVPFHKLPDSKRLYFFENELLEFIKSGKKCG